MKSNFPIVKLGSYIDELSVRNNKNRIDQVFSITNSEGFVKSTDFFDKEVFSKNISNYKIVLPSQFAYNPSRINVGSIDYLREDFPVVVSPLYAVYQCHPELTQSYLLNFLKSPMGNIQIRNKTRGAVRDNLTFDRLKDIDIPLPSIPNQIKIALLLSKIENLIKKRRNAILIADDFLKSQFNKLFGDPIKNEMGWESDYLENLVAPTCPVAYGIVQPGDEVHGGIPIVRPVDLHKRFIDRVGLKKIDPVVSKKYSRTVLKGNEILMSVRGVTGNMAFATEDLNGCNVSRGIVPLWFDGTFSKLFAYNLLKTKAFHNEVQRLTYGVALQQINLVSLRKIKLIKPPKQLQADFESYAIKLESIRRKHELSLQYLESLFINVSTLAFNGDLKLDKVLIDHIEPRTEIALNYSNLVLSKYEDNTFKKDIFDEVINRDFKVNSFTFEELAENIQSSLGDEEYDYNLIKERIFDALRGKGNIKLVQKFNRDLNKIMLKLEK
ncbi:restriction endonuclease subunit S [Pedobacter sp. NJ-S-72]